MDLISWQEVNVFGVNYFEGMEGDRKFSDCHFITNEDERYNNFLNSYHLYEAAKHVTKEASKEVPTEAVLFIMYRIIEFDVKLDNEGRQNKNLPIRTVPESRYRTIRKEVFERYNIKIGKSVKDFERIVREAAMYLKEV